MSIKITLNKIYKNYWGKYFPVILAKRKVRLALAFVAGFSLVVILLPFVNDVLMPLKQALDPTHGFKYINNLMLTDNQAKVDVAALKQIPKENILVIPKIQVDAIIYEGADDSALNLGIWRKPLSSNPSKGGNTVLTAHRFLYTFGPNTFYGLDRIEVGDKFFVYWNQVEYDYEVYEKREISPTEISVEDNTNESIITLYTCTKDAVSRILVRAKLIS